MKIEKALSVELKRLFSEIAQRLEPIFTAPEEGVKSDSIDAELYARFLQAQSEIEEDEEAYFMVIEAITLQIFIELAEQLANDMKQQLEKYSGPLPVISIEMLKQLSNVMESELSSKLKYYIDTYFSRVQKLIDKKISGKISEGKFRTSIELLQKSFKKSIPELIAMDTTGTFTSKIQRNLFRTFGLTDYLWGTQEDERVRGNPTGLYPRSVPSHFVMNGLHCKWDNEMVFSEDGGKTWVPKYGKMEKAHPGEAFNCRCMAQIYMDNLLSKIDRSL
jgi:uncharacterized protein with gpF-like domain